jgi:ubiquinone/menaquinone biosynthesis C-methylase UbiE
MGNQGIENELVADSDLQSRTLESLSSAVRYHRWLIELAAPYLGDHPIELGSGLGDYARSWLGTSCAQITVTDVDQSRLAYLRQRFSDERRVVVREIDILHPPEGQYSALVSINVLEHIPDHVGALAAAHRLVQAGGAVITFVPAFEFAMSSFDRQVGHVRRYTKATLADAYGRAGLVVERIHYVNAPGLLAWFVGMKLLSLTPMDGIGVRAWDRLVVPLARRLEELRPPPFGQSVFAVGRLPVPSE